MISRTLAANPPIPPSGIFLLVVSLLLWLMVLTLVLVVVVVIVVEVAVVDVVGEQDALLRSCLFFALYNVLLCALQRETSGRLRSPITCPVLFLCIGCACNESHSIENA